MTQEVIYLLLLAGGWLLRHYGFGSGVKLPGSPSPAAATNPNVPLLATVKAEAEAAVKTAVEDAVKAAMADLKSSINGASK
jgi:hypothetical protein